MSPGSAVRSSGGITEARIPLFSSQAGCANGGGLLKGADEARDAAKARVARVDLAYHDAAGATTAENPEARRPLLHTRYHNVPSLEETLNPGAAKW